MRPRKKQNPETMECCEQVLGCMTIIIYIFHEVLIRCLNSSNHASLSSIVLKIECQNPFVLLYGRQVNGYNRKLGWKALT